MAALILDKIYPDPEVIFQKFGDGVILINVTTGRVFEMNETGTRIWSLLREGSSVEEIVSLLSQEYAAAESQIRGDLEALMRKLTDEGMIVTGR